MDSRRAICSGSFSNLLEAQGEWARTRGIPLTPFPGHHFLRYCVTRLEDNLFRPLHPGTVKEIHTREPDQLDRPNKPGKMCALLSPLTLNCNIFDYWRYEGVQTVAAACGAEPGIDLITFKYKPETRLHGIASHIDVLLSGSTNRPTAIVTAFFQPYVDQQPLRLSKRHVDAPSVWSRLPRCGQLAAALLSGEAQFGRLDASQLIRRILALADSVGPEGFRLFYLWYDIGDALARRHCKDVAAFADAITPDVEFQACTYQELFARIRGSTGNHEEYLDYLEGRYFAPQSTVQAGAGDPPRDI